MKSPPTFSVCISTMDRPVELAQCLRSIIGGTVQPIEIVVSDDSRDTDATRRVCDEFAAARYVRGPCIGQGANRDSAARAARGDYFCFIDDDAIMSPAFLEQMHAAAASSSGREIFTGDILEADKRISPSNLTFLGHFGRVVTDRFETVNFNANAFPRGTLLVACFDLHLRYGYEDSDFCTQALAAGFRIVHLPSACNEHCPSPINRAASYQFREESRFYTSLKRYALIQKNPLKAIVYSVVAPIHEALHHLKRGRISEIRAIGRDMRIAVSNLRRQRRLPLPVTKLLPREAMPISVIVPTYRRPVELRRCLRALSRQLRKADELIVVLRADDTESIEVVQQFEALKIFVDQPGVVAALNAGMDASHGEVIAITDDDAEPRLDWLLRIERQFQTRPTVSGVGGRDVCGKTILTKRRVGILQWFGRLIGNHDAGAGHAREVDVLKGVNMSFRRTAIGTRRFDSRLRGSGAQVDHELQFCLALKRDGWRLIYDPAVIVDHAHASRQAGGDRIPACADAVRAATHNNTVATLEHLRGPAKVAFMAWALCVGTRRDFGIVQFVRFAPCGFSGAWARLRGSIGGRIDGYHTWRTSAN